MTVNKPLFWQRAMIRRKSDLFSKKSVRTHSSATAPSFFLPARLLHLFPKFPKRPTKMRAGRKGGFRGEFRPALHLVFVPSPFSDDFGFLRNLCARAGLEPAMPKGRGFTVPWNSRYPTGAFSKNSLIFLICNRRLRIHPCSILFKTRLSACLVSPYAPYGKFGRTPLRLRALNLFLPEMLAHDDRALAFVLLPDLESEIGWRFFAALLNHDICSFLLQASGDLLLSLSHNDPPPLATSCPMIRLATGVRILYWIRRFNGRAPYCGL